MLFGIHNQKCVNKISLFHVVFKLRNGYELRWVYPPPAAGYRAWVTMGGEEVIWHDMLQIVWIYSVCKIWWFYVEYTFPIQWDKTERITMWTDVIMVTTVGNGILLYMIIILWQHLVNKFNTILGQYICVLRIS